MQVEDIELKQPSLKRQLTPPTEIDSQPPAKRSVLEGEVKGEITTGEDGDVSEAHEDGDTVHKDHDIVHEGSEAGEDRETGENGDTVPEGGEAGKDDAAEQPALTDLTDTGEILPNNMPKIYDLFATCVSMTLFF